MRCCIEHNKKQSILIPAATKMLSHPFFLLALLLPLVSCADPIHQRCEQNITNNKALQVNIDKAIYAMIAATPPRGYAFGEFGTAGEPIYGITRCRGDIDTQACSDCIITATQRLRTSCPQSTRASVWYELCSARYGRDRFLTQMDTRDVSGWGATRKAANPTAFNAAVWSLLNWVKPGSAARPNKFGTGKMGFADMTIYGMAYCTPDLQGFMCMKCFEALSSMMRTNCADRVGCLIMCDSCGIRYEVYPFLQEKVIHEYQMDALSTPATT